VDNLRLILLLIGLLVLAAMVLLHKPSGETRRNHERWLSGNGYRRGKPAIDRPSGDESHNLPKRGPSSPANLAAGLASARLIDSDFDESEATRTGSAARLEQKKRAEKIVTLYVQRRSQRPITGTDLLESAIAAGLEFGEMNIFHRLHEGEREPVFSMANLTAPGHFNPSGWNAFSSEGVTFFLTLPGPISALDAWDAMLATARRMAELLDAEVLDDAHCLVTRQRIAQVREEMREYDRKHGLGARP